ncbi:MAG: ribosome maturation factor RimM [Oscillospiraceae bacterium]|nr:ribosome maturation factor RimM [Oscillospiraceae bacterium]
MKNELIEAGKIVNTHGIRGELRLQPWADSPDFLTGFEYLYIDEKPTKVLSSRVHKGCVIATLEGVTDIDAAIKMKNKVIKVKKADIHLEEGTYLIADLIGLSVEDAETGEQLGRITDVLSLPSNNVYVIQGEREILVPAVPEFIVETNLDEGYIKLRLIEGL